MSLNRHLRRKRNKFPENFLRFLRVPGRTVRLIANWMVVTVRSVSKSIAWYQRLAWETVGAFAPAWRRRRHGDPGDPRVSLMEERLTRIIPDRTRTSVEMVTLVSLSGPLR